MKKVELLSPAGNFDALKMAVQNGCDAVYVGGKKFGARAFSNNFDNEELVEAINYCHLYGVKIYITINTIVYDSEVEEFLKYIEFIYKNGVDAVIIQDYGMIDLIRQKFPNLELHSSTQMNIHTVDELKKMKELGFKRVVLARETSIETIKKKKKEVDIELEVFIHGALCVSCSGQCLMSYMVGKRSGNRGECVGSCRLPYTFYENDKKIDTNGAYLLSTKSLCTIENIGKIIDSGVTSLKIEGRMKSSDYVGYITRLYRTKIDEYYKNKEFYVTKEEINNIKKLYNRELTKGYLFDAYGKDLMNIKSSNHIGVHLGTVLKVDRNRIKIKLDDDLYQEDGIRFDNDKGMIINKLYDEKGLLVNKVFKGKIAYVDNKVEIKNAKEVRKTIDTNLNSQIRGYEPRKVPVNIYCKAKIGERLELVIDDGKNKIEKYGSIIEKSINSPTDYGRIKNQIEKLGSTPFKSTKTTIEMDDNIFISIKELNELRRELAQSLIERREFSSSYTTIKNKIKERKIEKKNDNLFISVLVRNETQLKTAIDNNVDIIYVTDYKLYKKYKNKNVFYRTKRVSDNLQNYENENLLATELGAITKYSENNNINADYFLNVVNGYTIEKLRELGATRVTLSPEIDDENIKILANYNNIDLYVYGRVELMVTKYCPMNMLVNNDNLKCNLCDINKYYLKDKEGNVYPLDNDKHLTHILDCKNYDLLDKIDEYMNYGVTSYRLDLYDEGTLEIENILKVIRYAYEHRDNK